MTTRLEQLNHWLSVTIHLENYQLEPVSGDASFRRYFRLKHNNASFIVMDAPPEQEDCVAFMNIAKRLSAIHIHVPKIIEKDLQQGFLLLGDLGNKQYLDVLTEENADDLYQSAMQALALMQQHGNISKLPSFDEKLLLQEMGLFRHWLLQEHLGLELTVTTQLMLDKVYKRLVDAAHSQPTVFVHRDYHSRNLMANNDDNPGVLDFQDAIAGPFTYDLVSLLKDCYIKWPRQQIQGWANNYFAQIADNYSDIKATQFMRWFDLMGVQRHLKASGIFARLYHQDGKIAYLNDIPRTLSYIIDLDGEYPELHGLIAFIQDQVMPAIARGK